MQARVLTPAGVPADVGLQVKLRECDGSHAQHWVFDVHPDVRGMDHGKDKGTLSGPEHALCLDNMQKKSGPPGLYGCHGYGTQRWVITADGKIQAGGDKATCIGFNPSIGMFRSASIARRNSLSPPSITIPSRFPPLFPPPCTGQSLG